jgi:hypothetical protein
MDSDETVDVAKTSSSDVPLSVVNEVYVRKSVGDTQATAAFALHRWPARSPRSSRLSLASQSQEGFGYPEMEVDHDLVVDADEAKRREEEEEQQSVSKGRTTKRGRVSSSSEDDWMVGGGASAEPSPRAED